VQHIGALAFGGFDIKGTGNERVVERRIAAYAQVFGVDGGTRNAPTGHGGILNCDVYKPSDGVGLGRNGVVLRGNGRSVSTDGVHLRGKLVVELI